MLNFRRSLIRIILSSSVLALVLPAQSQQTPADSYSIETVAGLALDRNGELIAARQRLAEAQGLLRQAGVRPNPSIDILVSNGDVFNSDGEREFSFAYSHVLELGGKRKRRIEVAQKVYELSKYEIANRERLLSSDIRIRYAEALAAMEKLRNAEDLLKLTDQNLELAKARAEVGEGSPLEQGLLQVEFNRISSDCILFAGQVEQALLQVKLLAGLPPGEPLRLSGTLEKATEIPDLDKSIELAMSSRADLAAARVNEQAAEAEFMLAKSTGIPDLVLHGGYSHAQSAFDQLGIAAVGGNLVPLRDKDNILSGGISIALPFSNRNQGNIESALARRRAAAATRESLERTVRSEIMSAHSRLVATHRALQLFTSGVISQSRENLRILRGAYELGELRILDVINEQRRLVETQRSYVDQLREAYVAGVEFDRATGTFVR